MDPREAMEEPDERAGGPARRSQVESGGAREAWVRAQEEPVANEAQLL